MMRRATVLLAGTALIAAPAFGQGGCVLVTDKPAQLRGATQAINKIRDDNPESSNVSEKPKHLERTLRNLAELDKIENQIGRHYLTGVVYAAYLRSNAKNIQEVMVREDLGMYDNPKGTHDLYAAVDTALSKVEALNAACVDSTAVVRFRVYSIPFNKARALMNAGKFDSAELVAKRALVVDPKSGAPWNLIAQVRQRKGDTKGYVEALEIVVQSLSGDSAARNVRQQAYFNLGVLNSGDAEKSLDEATRIELGKKSVGYFNEFLKLKPGDPQGRTALARALKLAGDSAQAYAIFKEMLKTPAQFTPTQLFAAGKDAFDAELYEDAVSFFEAGLGKSAHSRDGLFNLANTHVRTNAFDKAAPLLPRLFAVDPLNRDNFILASNVWRGITNATAENSPAQKAALDSNVHYIKLRDSSAISVKPDAFAPPATGDVTLEGAVHNYTAAPRNFSMIVEFLNANGAVVGAAQTVEVTDIPAKTGKRFSVTGKGAGISAYRYKPAT